MLIVYVLDVSSSITGRWQAFSRETDVPEQLNGVGKVGTPPLLGHGRSLAPALGGSRRDQVAAQAEMLRDRELGRLKRHVCSAVHCDFCLLLSLGLHCSRAAFSSRRMKGHVTVQRIPSMPNSSHVVCLELEPRPC